VDRGVEVTVPQLKRRFASFAELWALAVHTSRSHDASAAVVRARHLGQLVRLTPVMMVANVLNAAVAAVVCWGTVLHAELAAWLVTVGVVALVGLRGARGEAPRVVSPRAVSHAQRHAAYLAGLWALLPAVFLPQVDASQRFAIGCLVTGMLCGGAFALASLPSVALTYLAILTVGSVFGLIRTPMDDAPLIAVLLVVYVAVMALGILWTAGLATERLLALEEVARQRELVAVLLADFEESADDVLWSTDPEGRLTHVSPRLAERFGEPEAALAGTSILDVFARHAPPEGEDFGHAQLSAAFEERRALRALAVAVDVDGARRYWLLSAKPLATPSEGALGWRGVITDFTSEHEAEARLAYLAHFDPLTGLVNRHRMNEAIALRLAAHTPESSGDVLVCIDIDHFKEINEAFGHGAGDQVLQVLAERMRSFADPQHVVARLGGDELGVLFVDVDPEQAQQLTRALHTALTQPADVGGRRIPLSASLGYALLPLHGRTVDEALAHADLALYAAKSAGQNRVEAFVEQLGDKNRRHQALAHALRGAIEAGSLELYWQPKIELNLRQAVGAEALVRWHDPVLGAVSPAEFIPVAEQVGLIEPLGAWVLQTACMQAADELHGLSIAVNVSPAQFVRSDFVELVREALGKSGLHASRLELEVTESLFLSELPVVERNVAELKALGVRIALDDFGTGYSSLAYLQRFRFDTLKIDRSFVREIRSKHDAMAVVAMIIQLGATLGMTTVAEGVEDPAQLETLAEAGCHVVQGYVFAKPMPLAELVAFVASHQDQPVTPGVASSPRRPWRTPGTRDLQVLAARTPPRPSVLREGRASGAPPSPRISAV
jgi:diguanylate cyclase (GGDEF)-like protein/PAS domain S-box-containing protein